MKQKKELEYYEEIKDWDFSQFEIETESLTKWDLYEILRKLSNKESKILDLGTGGGEKVIEQIKHIVKEKTFQKVIILW